jgi:uncharacterized protein (DUF488 family)
MKRIDANETSQTKEIFTVGHSTRTSDEFLALLREFEVNLVADVRAFPRSRTNPQFNADTLGETLSAAGIGYRHLKALGGRRHRSKEAPPSLNTLWRNESFRNYADYAASDAFQCGLDELRALAIEQRCAIMCSEAVWWRCHRRIISDYLLTDGYRIMHVLGPGKAEPATLTPGARSLPDGTLVTLVYPAAADT